MIVTYTRYVLIACMYKFRPYIANIIQAHLVYHGNCFYISYYQQDINFCMALDAAQINSETTVGHVHQPLWKVSIL